MAEEASDFPGGPLRGTVLIVEDDDDFRVGLAALVRRKGYHALEVAQAADAEALCREQPIAIVLVDVRLGRDDGIDLIRRVRSIRPGTVCIVMTAYAEAEVVISALHAQAYGFLRKPFAAAELFAILERCDEQLRLEREAHRVQEALRQRNAELEAINDRLLEAVSTFKGFTAGSRVGDLGSKLLSEIGRNLECRGGSLFLLRGNSLELIEALDPGHAPKTIPLPPQPGSILETVLENREPLLVADVESEADLEPCRWQGYRNGSALALPVLDPSDEIAGVVFLHNKISPPFTRQDLYIAQLLLSLGFAVVRATQAAEDVEASEKRYRDLVENAHDIVYTHDLTGSITSFNSAGERITGYSVYEVLGRNVSEFMDSESNESIAEIIDRQVIRGSAVGFETEIVTKSGRKVLLDVKARGLYEDDRPVGVQGIARDITERRELEEKLRQAQKMEAIGRLAGGIAHDFNNLLTAITGFADLAMIELTAGDPLRSIIGEIVGAADRANSLTNQLLAFSRKQILQSKLLDLNDVLADTETMLRRLIGEDISLVTVPSSRIGMVRADPGQIQQVLMNLAVNSRDAMPQGGRLTIETFNAEVPKESDAKPIMSQEGRYVALIVSDTGIGMTEHERRHIFEPFFTTKDRGKGTGLGLSMVYGIVTQSHGEIRVHSKPGAGTTFSILFPRVVDPPLVRRPDGERADPRGGSETILVVEDDESVLKLSANILGRMGYVVHQARDGLEALELFEAREERFDLLLTDVVMPRMGGPELAQRLTRLRPEVRVLFMSGYTDDAVVRHGLDDGNAFLQKPYRPNALLKKVREVLDLPSGTMNR